MNLTILSNGENCIEAASHLYRRLFLVFRRENSPAGIGYFNCA
jgi:hypothetical protein